MNYPMALNGPGIEVVESRHEKQSGEICEGGGTDADHGWINILVGKVSVVSWTVDFRLYLHFITRLILTHSACLHSNSPFRLV